MAYTRSNVWRRLNGPSITSGPTRTAADTAVCSPADSPVLIEAGQVIAGTKLRISASGKLSSVITTPGVARFLAKMGIITAWDTRAILLDTVAAHVNMPFKLQIDLDCRVAGASTTAQLFGSGLFFCENILGSPASPPKAGAVAILPWAVPPDLGTGFDSTIDNVLTLHSTQIVATGSLTLEQWTVEQCD